MSPRHRAAACGLILSAFLTASGCVSTAAMPETAPAVRDTHEQLHAVLWMQTAAEFRALSLQTYQSAGRLMDQALADRNWTAAVEQTGNFASLPPAVIVDVDETVLDNSAYQARLIESGASYSSVTWKEWVDEERATALPGALEFARAAAAKGVTIFYVTNRKAIEEEPTRRNLIRLGFPIPASPDVLLVRGERPEWSKGDKTPRRSFVAASYRVLFQIGDNLGDFIAEEDLTIENRFEVAERYRDFWGTRWFMIPNPAYGHWEEAILDYSFDQSDAEKLRMKREHLNDGRNPVD